MKSEKSQFIENLEDWKYREAYIRASINVNLPSQIRALRLKQEMTQKEFAAVADMKQPRISAMEKPGATKFNIETLIRVAAAFKVGLIVKFVPVSEMLAWENGFSQDSFNVPTFEQDMALQRASASVFEGKPSPTPVWFLFDSPGTPRAFPEVSHNTTMTPPPPDAGSVSTAGGIQYQQRLG